MKLTRKLASILLTITLLLGLFPLVSPVSPAQAVTTWSKYSGNVAVGSERFPMDAWVIKDGTTYKMWYTRVSSNLSITQILNIVKAQNLNNIVAAISSTNMSQLLDSIDDLSANVSAIKNLLDSVTTTIGYATSTDGKNWTIQNSQALVGSSSSFWAKDPVGTPTVIKESDTSYKMWYTRVNTSLTQGQLSSILTDLGSSTIATRKQAILDLLNSTYTVIGYATSDNGTDWVVQNPQSLVGTSSGLWTKPSVGTPAVIKDGTTYKMWYTRSVTDLTSGNLTNILTNTGSFNVATILDVFDGTNSVIGYATSDNGTDWVVQNPQMLSGGPGLWQSVADPTVIKTDSTYEMWYTNVSRNLVTSGLNTLLSEIKNLGISSLWNTLKNTGVTQLITDLAALNVTTIQSLLSGSGTIISYATSSNGVDWTTQSVENLVGNSASLWSSVSSPSVVKTGEQYEIWFSKGLDSLTMQKITERLLGLDTTVGYAVSLAPSLPPGGGPLPPPPLPIGATPITTVVDAGGIAISSFAVGSPDNQVALNIPAGTRILDVNGQPTVQWIQVIPDVTPPSPPQDTKFIGVVYNLGPEGVKFSPPITLTMKYDPLNLPAGVNENNLVIALWDASKGEWVKLPSTVDTVLHTIKALVSNSGKYAILAGTRPAAFTVSELTISPLEVNVGEVVTASVTVTNTGDLAGSYSLSLQVSNVVLETKQITLGGGASQKVTFSFSRDAAGTYIVNIGQLSGSVKVKARALPTPATFVVRDLTISPASVDIGATTTISAVVANTGDISGNYKVTLKINGAAVGTKEVTLAGGSSEKVTFSVTKDVAGSYTVEIAGLSGTFTVKAPSTLPPTPQPKAKINWGLISGAIAIFVITVVIVVVLVRRQRSFR